MGNTGIAKMLFPLDNVENRYGSIAQIDLMTTQKTILKAQHRPTVIVIFRSTASAQTIKKMQSSFGNKAQLLLVPDADSHLCTFQELSQRYPGCLAKMAINGPYTHPLIRYLKRNCSQFYDVRLVGGKKHNQNIGIFTISSQNQVKYFKEEELSKAVKIFDLL